jgi:hypothetical protein
MLGLPSDRTAVAADMPDWCFCLPLQWCSVAHTVVTAPGWFQCQLGLVSWLALACFLILSLMFNYFSDAFACKVAY